MNLFTIALKEMKHNLKDKHSMIMMVIYPIVIILILGYALSGSFNNSITFKYNKILYSIEGKNNNFNEFLKTIKDLGIESEQIQSKEEALKKVENGSYTCYIDVNEDNGEITFYKNKVYNFKGDLIETILQSYVERYNAIREIYLENPESLEEILKDNDFNYVQESSMENGKKPRALDYYAVTMLTMIIMYGSLKGSFSIEGEYIRNTFNRIMCAPVSKYEILTGKLLGSIIVTFSQGLIVILFTKYVFKTYWGENMIFIYILIFSQVIMSISLGVGVAFMTNKETLSSSLLNMIAPIMTFLGGGYIPLEGYNNKALNIICKLSPLKWTNDGIFNYIYSNNYSTAYTAIIINLCVAILFLTISSLIYKKKVI